MFESFKAKKRLSELEERVETLERTCKQVRLEWDDAYERMIKLQQRITKRAQVVERAEAEEAEDEVEQSGTVDESALTMTPRQRTIQAQILAQRGRRNNGLLPG